MFECHIPDATGVYQSVMLKNTLAMLIPLCVSYSAVV